MTVHPAFKVQRDHKDPPVHKARLVQCPCSLTETTASRGSLDSLEHRDRRAQLEQLGRKDR